MGSRMIEELLSRLPQSTIRMGMERIEGACLALGRPQAAFPSVLVAGTNGKGSTCAFLESILSRRGAKIGLYTSPHLVSFRERIRVGGAAVSEEELERAGRRLLEAWPPFGAPDHPDALTYFEAATALAFEVFASAEVDLAILEVGLGGRLDATNVAGTRRCASVITRIAMDHMEYLGDTMEAIAGEKAAIARAGTPLIVAAQDDAALRVIRRRAAEVGAELVEVGRDVRLTPGDDGLSYRGAEWQMDGLHLGLLGEHQIENAAVAVAAAEAIASHALREKGSSSVRSPPARRVRESLHELSLGVGPEEVRQGLAAARWPGRLEVISEAPLVILDGAHNPDGAAALARAFPRLWPGRRPELVFGVLGEKDRLPMMQALFPLAARVHLCAPASPRAIPPEILAREGEAIGPPLVAHPSVDDALRSALTAAGAEGRVLVCGSLYLVGAVRGSLLAERSEG